jgi:flagellar hook-length control protein FliK
VAQADVATRDGRIDFHLHLEPANLGTVHVYLTASDQTVSARIVAAHDSTQAALAGQAHELRAALTQAGVSLGSFDLAGGQGGGQGGSPGHPGDQGGPPPSSAGAAAPPRPNGTTGPSPTVVAVGINLLA